MADATFLDIDEFENEYVAQTVTADKKQFIIRSTIIDSKNVLRTRSVLTPSMCTRPGCKFDAATRYGGWEYTPESRKEEVRDVLVQHDRVLHNRSEDLIVDEDQLPTEWLGDDAKKKPHLSAVIENARENAGKEGITLK